VSVATDKKRTLRILPRGNWMDETGEVMKPALPGYLPRSQALDEAAAARGFRFLPPEAGKQV
jgi:hypothetical protein